jgi:hypothetical protein
MAMARSLWIGAVVAATAAACSSSTSPAGGGGADGGDDAAFGQDATSDTAAATEASSDGSPDAVEASSHGDSGTDAGLVNEGGSGTGAEDAGEASVEASVEAGAEASTEGGVEASTEGGAEAGPESGIEAGLEAGTDEAGGEEAGAEAGSGSEAGADAGSEAGIVAPTCDGVVSPGEYGGSANQGTSGTQTWFMTWDDSNLYLAIENANVQEGNVVYVAIAPGTDAGPSSALTQGQPYDDTDITTLPFAASLVVYAHDGYTEARTPSSGAWNTQSSNVQICDNAGTSVREEVVPWSLVGGRPASFGWFGYLAAAPGSNPQGYIYGQVPSDNPGGQPANAETYTKYYAVPDSTPGKDGAFSDEQ